MKLPKKFKADGNYVRDLILFDIGQFYPKFERIQVDASIYLFVLELNRAGFVTNFCCSGLSEDHYEDDGLRHAYIGFDLWKMSPYHVAHLQKRVKNNKLFRVEEDYLGGMKSSKRLFVHQIEPKHCDDANAKRLWKKLAKDIFRVEMKFDF